MKNFKFLLLALMPLVFGVAKMEAVAYCQEEVKWNYLSSITNNTNYNVIFGGETISPNGGSMVRTKKLPAHITEDGLIITLNKLKCQGQGEPVADTITYMLRDTVNRGIEITNGRDYLRDVQGCEMNIDLIFNDTSKNTNASSVTLIYRDRGGNEIGRK